MPRLSRETLFAVVRETEQRQRLAEQRIATLQREYDDGGAGRTIAAVSKELDAEQKLAVELVTFRDEAERIANLGWEPDLGDGAVLNAAPLASLFPAWKDAAKYRKELKQGQAHLVDGLEVRGSVVTAVRDHLAGELANKLQRHGVVIWDDREQSYGAVVGEIAPEGISVAKFDGSWFALRRDIEAQLAGATSPNLLVYVSAPAPDPDPLEELRAVGASYRSLLPTVIRASLRGQLTDRRLEELGKQCQTLGRGGSRSRSGCE